MLTSILDSAEKVVKVVNARNVVIVALKLHIRIDSRECLLRCLHFGQAGLLGTEKEPEECAKESYVGKTPKMCCLGFGPPVHVGQFYLVIIKQHKLEKAGDAEQ